MSGPQAVCIFVEHPPSAMTGGFRLNISGGILLNFESIIARKEFVEGATVWWYCFPEDADAAFGGSGGAIGQPRRQNLNPQTKPWIKGGAWEAAEIERQYEGESIEREDIW